MPLKDGKLVCGVLDAKSEAIRRVVLLIVTGLSSELLERRVDLRCPTRLDVRGPPGRPPRDLLDGDADSRSLGEDLLSPGTSNVVLLRCMAVKYAVAGRGLDLLALVPPLGGARS